MAQKTTVQLVDDIDGSEAAETVSFGLDGNSYEIDLSEEHASSLREVLSRFIVSARRAGSDGGGRRSGGRRGSGTSTSSSHRQRTAEIRRWAREQGMEVNERGRIPNQIVQAYDAAH
jgi:hypothetical protein